MNGDAPSSPGAGEKRPNQPPHAPRKREGQKKKGGRGGGLQPPLPRGRVLAAHAAAFIHDDPALIREGLLELT